MEWFSVLADFASVLGLAFSAATLVVAALVKAKIDAARLQVLAKVDSVETAWHAANADTALSELLAYCDTRNWAFALDRCRAILRLLHSLKMSGVLPASDLIAIRRGIDDLKMIQTSIDVKHQRHDRHDLKAKNREVLSQLSIALANVRAAINRLIREV